MTRTLSDVTELLYIAADEIVRLRARVRELEDWIDAGDAKADRLPVYPVDLPIVERALEIEDPAGADAINQARAERGLSPIGPVSRAMTRAEIEQERDEARRIAVLLHEAYPRVLSDEDARTVEGWR